MAPLKKLYHRVKGTVSRQRSIPCGLGIVKDPKNADIDIVAVHGLGQGFESWVTSEKGRRKPWLEELLASDIPTARIMTYVYPSEGVNYRYLVRNVLYGRALDLVKELASRRRLDGTARRPLFFIAHSLGGWIVKRALIISSEAADALKDVELSTCGVVFFGTPSPGRPSAPSPLAHVIRTTTARSLDAAAHRGWGAAQPQVSDTAWLENQMEAFKAITATVPLISFHETKQEDGRFVVEKRHSMSGSDGERIGLTATHFDLVRFAGRDDNYTAFIERFRSMMDPARVAELLWSKRETHERASEARRHDYLGGGFDGIPYRLPGLGGRATVLRRDLLEQIETALEPPVDQEKVPLHLGIASILGEAGTGKTMLARQYADMHRDDFSFVFWIHAESWETVVASFLDFAGRLVGHHAKKVPRDQVERDLGLGGVGEMLKARGVRQLDAFRVRGVVRAVKDWLMRPGNDRWLLVFDNAEPSLDIVEFIPLSLTGRIILTCREAGSCTWGTNILVEEMREDEAVDALKAVLDGAPKCNGEEEAALRLVRRLGCHARSISLAGDIIRKRGMTIGKYEAELPIPWSLGLMDQCPAARKVLSVSAMLSSSAIPAGLFSKEGILQTVRGKDSLQAALEFLSEQNLIQTSPQTSRMNSFSSDGSSCTTNSSASIGSFTMLPAAREHLRSTLTPAQKAENALLACKMCVRGIRDNETTSFSLPEIQDFGRVMAPHAKTCYDDWSQILRDVDDKGVPIAWHVLGNVCMTQGLSEQAKGCFELSLRHAKMSAAERIQTSLSLASLLQQSGDPGKAAEMLAETDSGRCNDKTLGFRVALARASAAAARGELSQAEDEYGMLEQEQEESLGVTDATTMETVRRLAATVELQGRLEEAQALWRRVHMTRRITLGPGHPMTVEALDELARVCREANAVDEAEELYRRSVEVKTRALGGGHWRTAHALQRLAVMDDVRCRYAEAREKYRAALGVMVGALGGAHPLCMTTMENMALSRRLHGGVLGQRIHGRLSQGKDGVVEGDGEGNKGGEDPGKEEITRDGAFAEAEQIYLEVMRIKRAAGMVYTERQVVDTGSKLREMYENEEYYREVREDKVARLMGVLRARRRETV